MSAGSMYIDVRVRGGGGGGLTEVLLICLLSAVFMCLAVLPLHHHEGQMEDEVT